MQFFWTTHLSFNTQVFSLHADTRVMKTRLPIIREWRFEYGRKCSYALVMGM